MQALFININFCMCTLYNKYIKYRLGGGYFLMENKYKMSQAENVFVAKRLIVDAVYKSANLEGIAVTFAQTVDILNDVNVDSLKPSEISKVCCIRDAWHFILNNINSSLDLAFIEDVHELIAKSELDYRYLGKVRTDNVLISGTSWRPEIPNLETLHAELMELLKIKNETDRALTIMLWIMRNQIFKDGNKRVATIIANKLLIENGCGIISIPVELDGTFKSMLVKYYETNNMNDLKQWLYDNCIDGVN